MIMFEHILEMTFQSYGKPMKGGQI